MTGEAGLVDVRGDASRRFHRVRAEPLRAVDEWLEPRPPLQNRLGVSTRPRAAPTGSPDAPAAGPTERDAFWFWLKLGCISFGGPAGQIAIMHAELVERRGWIPERRVLHALNFWMALPGPKAQQLASHIGHSLYGVRGAITSGGHSSRRASCCSAP